MNSNGSFNNQIDFIELGIHVSKFQTKDIVCGVKYFESLKKLKYIVCILKSIQNKKKTNRILLLKYLLYNSNDFT